MREYLYWIPGHMEYIDSDKFGFPLEDIVHILDEKYSQNKENKMEVSTDLFNKENMED